MKIARILGPAMMLLLAPCAAMNYPKYAEHQATIYVKQAEAKAETAKALGQAATSEDARSRDLATMALLVQALTDKPLAIEAPREGALERGVESLLRAVPAVAAMGLVVDGMKGHGGSNTTQTVSGAGAGGVVGAGTANPATSPPTVVEQPEPVVVTGP